MNRPGQYFGIRCNNNSPPFVRPANGGLLWRAPFVPTSCAGHGKRRRQTPCAAAHRGAQPKASGDWPHSCAPWHLRGDYFDRFDTMKIANRWEPILWVPSSRPEKRLLSPFVASSLQPLPFVIRSPRLTSLLNRFMVLSFQQGLHKDIPAAFLNSGHLRRFGAIMDREGTCSSFYDHSILWSQTRIQNESDPMLRWEDFAPSTDHTLPS
jgi:hypothetical protein